MIAFWADNSPGDWSRDQPGQILQIPADHPTLQPLFMHVCVVMCMIAGLLFTHSCLLASASVCVSVCVCFALLSVDVCFFSRFLLERERLRPSCTHGHTVWRQAGAVSPLRDVEGPWGWWESLNEGEWVRLACKSSSVLLSAFKSLPETKLHIRTFVWTEVCVCGVCVCVCVCVCACYSVDVRAFLKMYQKCSKTDFWDLSILVSPI